MAKSQDERFQIIHKETISFGGGCKIIVDKQTGVNYLFCESGYAGGLTPLLDETGKPVITKE